MKKWEILNQSKVNDIIQVLLTNRGIKTVKEKKEFLEPTPPEKITVESLSLSKVEINKSVRRIKKARKDGKQVIVFGDYDADGVCATAILWECLNAYGLNVLPYIPERFSEGYGLKGDSIKKLKSKYPDLSLIITVDNGIVAVEAVKAANKLGIDVIVTDHHQPGKKLPKANAIIHTTETSGSAVAWVLARELGKNIKSKKYSPASSLELAAIGTIADQLPLVGVNRSFAKYGLEALKKTERVGLLALFEEARVGKGTSLPAGRQVGTYTINFAIAPRINAMGRLEHAIESLRLLCTTDEARAQKLANLLGSTNQQRQKVVDEVVVHAIEAAGKDIGQVIILAHESYHEGVIGLAASRLVERFYRPAIVLSVGEKFSKASARSISGFNIIETLRTMEDLWVEGGGHPMAAGFTIETAKLDLFTEKFSRAAENLLTKDLLTRKLRIDLELSFGALTQKLYEQLAMFEPAGIGNPTPTFVTSEVEVVDSRVVGRDAKHLKLVLRKDGITFGAIAFGFGYLYSKLQEAEAIDVAFNLMENEWMGEKKLELRIKDIKLSE